MLLVNRSRGVPAEAVRLVVSNRLVTAFGCRFQDCKMDFPFFILRRRPLSVRSSVTRGVLKWNLLELLHCTLGKRPLHFSVVTVW